MSSSDDGLDELRLLAAAVERVERSPRMPWLSSPPRWPCHSHREFSRHGCPRRCGPLPAVLLVVPLFGSILFGRRGHFLLPAQPGFGQGLLSSSARASSSRFLASAASSAITLFLFEFSEQGDVVIGVFRFIFFLVSIGFVPFNVVHGGIVLYPTPMILSCSRTCCLCRPPFLRVASGSSGFRNSVVCSVVSCTSAFFGAEQVEDEVRRAEQRAGRGWLEACTSVA